MRLAAICLSVVVLGQAGLAVAGDVGPSLLDPHAAAPPAAQQDETVRELHGDRVVDLFAWMRNGDDPAVIDYLDAENAYTDAVMAPVADLEQRLYEEMIGRLEEADSTYPVRYGDYWYHQAVGENEEHWDIIRQAGAPDAPEEVILDVNALAAAYDYFNVVGWDVTRDGRYLAYQTDTSGGLEYSLTIVDLETGATVGEPIDLVDGLAWAPDGHALYYVAVDEALRGYEVRRHLLDGDGPDAVIYSEADTQYTVGLALSADRRFVVITSAASDTSEVRFLDPYADDAEPVLLLASRPGIQYRATHAGGRAIIRINDTSPNFRVVATTLADLAAGVAAEAWTELVPARDDVVVDGANIYARHMVVFTRADGLSRLEIVDPATGETLPVQFPEPSYSLYGEWNPEYDTDTFLYAYESQITPYSVYALDMATGESTLLDRDAVPGGYDPTDYETRRIFATASDGTRIPISIAFARTTPLDGTAPLLLEAYGAYGSTYDPYFDRTMLSLLDRGVIYAYAHVRGGGEYGLPWYEGGRMATKMNTFTDVIAVAEHLIAERYSAADRMVATGASAGGLTIGAAVNMRPDLFRAAVLNVPFVDVLTVMLDASLPLTTLEYTEWGNPEVAEEYAWMRAYDPYPNLAARDYPALLVLTALNDDQVPFWQPTKYVARLRTLVGDDGLVLLSADTGVGHGGDPGRFEGLRRWAFQYAFVLGVLGIGE